MFAPVYLLFAEAISQAFLVPSSIFFASSAIIFLHMNRLEKCDNLRPRGLLLCMDVSQALPTNYSCQACASSCGRGWKGSSSVETKRGAAVWPVGMIAESVP
ncbi:hypothetical protein V8F33_002690 [Rhypophila sp. PSN 637]